jgi:very-short-patch-repair endonuclease
LAKAGFKVLRLWNHEVLKESESVKEKIWRTVQSI